MSFDIQGIKWDLRLHHLCLCSQCCVFSPQKWGEYIVLPLWRRCKGKSQLINNCTDLHYIPSISDKCPLSRDRYTYRSIHLLKSLVNSWTDLCPCSHHQRPFWSFPLYYLTPYSLFSAGFKSWDPPHLKQSAVQWDSARRHPGVNTLWWLWVHGPSMAEWTSR